LRTAADYLAALSPEEVRMLTVMGMHWSPRQSMKYGAVINETREAIARERVMSEAAVRAWQKRRAAKNLRKAG
jgi:hypothetical protein